MQEIELIKIIIPLRVVEFIKKNFPLIDLSKFVSGATADHADETFPLSRFHFYQGESFPPINLRYSNGMYSVINGRHRLAKALVFGHPPTEG